MTGRAQRRGLRPRYAAYLIIGAWVVAVVVFGTEEAEALGAVTADDVLVAFGDLISEADRSALTGEFAKYVASGTRGGLRAGIWGWFDDDMAFVHDWGFDLGSIEVPVAIWQGDNDRFVPFAHGRWLADNVSGAEPFLRAGEGHLSIAISAYCEVLDQVMRAAT